MPHKEWTIRLWNSHYERSEESAFVSAGMTVEETADPSQQAQKRRFLGTPVRPFVMTTQSREARHCLCKRGSCYDERGREQFILLGRYAVSAYRTPGPAVEYRGRQR